MSWPLIYFIDLCHSFLQEACEWDYGLQERIVTGIQYMSYFFLVCRLPIRSGPSSLGLAVGWLTNPHPKNLACCRMLQKTSDLDVFFRKTQATESGCEIWNFECQCFRRTGLLKSVPGELAHRRDKKCIPNFSHKT